MLGLAYLLGRLDVDEEAIEREFGPAMIFLELIGILGSKWEIHY